MAGEQSRKMMLVPQSFFNTVMSQQQLNPTSQYIQQLGNQATGILQAPNLSSEAKAALYDQMFTQYQTMRQQQMETPLKIETIETRRPGPTDIDDANATLDGIMRGQFRRRSNVPRIKHRKKKPRPNPASGDALAQLMGEVEDDDEDFYDASEGTSAGTLKTLKRPQRSRKATVRWEEDQTEIRATKRAKDLKQARLDRQKKSSPTGRIDQRRQKNV
jgi:hypothetical protein